MFSVIKHTTEPLGAYCRIILKWIKISCEDVNWIKLAQELFNT
jgi:hypothetical protein